MVVLRAVQDVPSEVPGHVFHECLRLSCLGTAGSNAKKEFQLTDGDLKSVPHIDKSRCGSMAQQYV